MRAERPAIKGDIMQLSVPRHVLFATDLSARCDRAQDRAIQLALEWRARLTVVHAVESVDDLSGLPQTQSMPAAITRAAKLLEEELMAMEDLQARVNVRRGRPIDVINDVLASDPADLVVTGISRNDTLGRWLLGSTTTSLIRESGRPVLVVKKKPIEADGTMLAASDFSTGSATATNTAVAFFRPDSLVLFHAFDPPFKNWADDSEAYLHGFHTECVRQAWAFVERAIDAKDQIDISVVAEAGDPPGRIASYVADYNIDMVVTGTEGRKGLMNIFLESVAARILEQVPCDVFVVPNSNP